MPPSLPTPPTPLADPPYLTSLPSPYHTPTHHRWQRALRTFISTHLLPQAWEWDDDGTVPEHVWDTFAKANMLVPSLPAPLPVSWLKRVGVERLLGDVRVEEFDGVCGGIYCDEMARSGLAGPSGSLTVGIAFGLPPLLNFGSPALQERFVPDFLLGRKRICIAITEPDAGSDVARVQTTAERSADGRHFIVNGAKKWITNGIWSDYATMAVRTGGPGAAGLSLLLVPLKNTPGVTMRRIKVAGQMAAGTTFIELDDVEVPVENLIGEEGQGMKYIMTNFNHERLTMAISSTRYARVALSSAMDYVLKREAFGKPLIDQPVVRHRLAKCAAELESLQAWVDQIVYQMSKLPKDEADIKLGGLTALAKARAGIVFDECARCAVLLFGGNGYTKTGQGEIAERLYREVPGQRIPGGSEDVLLDLAIRQLVKNYRNQTKMLERPRGSSKL